MTKDYTSNNNTIYGARDYNNEIELNLIFNEDITLTDTELKRP